MVSNTKTTPDFLIIGPPKSGTTSLYHILNKHPQIKMTSIKEPHFFSKLNYEDAIDNDNDYFSLFKHAGGSKIQGEASTSYFPFYNKSICNISNKVGKNINIVVILRDPCKRAFSHYQYYKKLGREAMPFSAVISKEHVVSEEPWGGVINPYIEFGFYFNAVDSYIKNFKNIHFIYLEELEKSYDQTLKKLLVFLNVDSLYVPKNEVRNVSGELRLDFLKTLINNPFLYKYIIAHVPYGIKVSLRNVLLKRKEMELKDLKYLERLYVEDYQKTQKIIREYRK